MTRPMHEGLASALDGLTAADRRVVVRLANEGRHSPLLARLLGGLRWQILADQFAEDRVLRRLEDDHRAEVEEIDRRVNGEPPPVVGRPATFDPETRTWSDD